MPCAFSYLRSEVVGRCEPVICAVIADPGFLRNDDHDANDKHGVGDGQDQCSASDNITLSWGLAPQHSDCGEHGGFA
jgi:hypothetical protein